MSDKQTPEQTADAVLKAQDEQNANSQTNFSQPIIIERKNSNGRGLATGALALSIIALGASGFLFVQGQNIFQMQEMKIHQELEKAALGESDNARKLAQSLDEQSKLNTMVAQLDVGQRDNRKHLADIQRAYQELLKGRVNWLVDEIEVTLNLAAQQLVLSGNVPVAISVLESIEQRLSRFEQSELLPIKRAISQDLTQLKQNAGAYMDISGTVLKLDSLEKAVAGLPLVVDSTLQEKATNTAPVAESADFWVRTWDKTIHMLQSMVEIRKLDSNDAMLLAPEQIYFVRANLRLRLLDARLALMQHNHESYHNNLSVVESTVKQYFDVSSPTTQKWLEDLAQIGAKNLSIVSDDVLKDSQAAVRDYQNKTRTAVPVNLIPVEELPAVVLDTVEASSVSAVNETASEPVEKENIQETSKAASVAAETMTETKKEVEVEAKENKKSDASESEKSVQTNKKADNTGKFQTGKPRAVGLSAPAAIMAALAESAEESNAEPVNLKSESVQKATIASTVKKVAESDKTAASVKREESRQTKQRVRERERERMETVERTERRRERHQTVHKREVSENQETERKVSKVVGNEKRESQKRQSHETKKEQRTEQLTRGAKQDKTESRSKPSSATPTQQAKPIQPKNNSVPSSSGEADAQP